MKHWKKSVAAVLALVLAVGLAACAAPEGKESGTMDPTGSGTPVQTGELKKVLIGAMDDDGALTDNARIAQSQGFLEEELAKVGYAPEYVSFGWGGTPLAEAMTAGEIEVIMSDSMSQLLLKASGTEIEAIAAVNTRIQNGIAVQTDSGIRTARDLEGKKVIVPVGSTAELFFNQLVEAEGIDASTIERVNSVSDLVTIFANKEADAVMYGLYTAYYMESYGLGTAIEPTFDHPERTGQTFVAARGTYWEEHPDVAKAIIRALNRAQAWAEKTVKTDADAVYAAMSKDETAAAINARIYSYDTTFSYFKTAIDQESRDKLQTVVDYLVAQEMIDAPVDLNVYLNTAYLDAVAAEQ